MLGGHSPNAATARPVSGLGVTPAARRASAAAAPLLPDQLVVQVPRAGVKVPRALRVEVPGGRVRVEGEVEEGAHLVDDVLVTQAYEHLDAAVQVAVHHVGRSDPRRRLAAVVEPEDPAVLQEAAQD